MTRALLPFTAGLLTAVAAAGCQSAPVHPASTAPIFQPGAPGQPARVLSPLEAGNLAGITHTADDVRFMQDMMRHHRQALEMTALVPSRTERGDIRLLAERIGVSQSDEIKRMREWLEARGAEVPAAADAHMHHDGVPMPGMLTAAEMQRLADARGSAFDRLFLELMIKHHEGALVMANALFDRPGAGQEAEVFGFATDVISDQQMEIARMKRMINAG